MTLDDMIYECLRYTDNGIKYKVKYQDRFISSINYAKNKISKEKYAPNYTENVTIDADQKFSLDSLTKQFSKLIYVKGSNNYSISTYVDAMRTIYCPSEKPGDVVAVNYEYIPIDLVSTMDVLGFPSSIVDPKVLCKFAAYEYFLAEGGASDLQKSTFWLGLWNDGFESINRNIGEVNQIQSVYTM